MKKLNQFITEKFRLSKDNITKYKYYPRKIKELKDILKKRLAKDKNANLNDIDVSGMTTLSGAFFNLDPHNIDISEWDTSNVVDMFGVFWGCKNFNSDVSGWDVSNVENMENLFGYCEKFDSDLTNWNISKVTNITYMFINCQNFKCDLNHWDTSSIISDFNAFQGSALEDNPPKWYKNIYTSKK